MDKKEILSFVAEKVAAGLTLSQIQDELKSMGQKMTFMELRLLASEIESGVFREQEKQAEPEKENTPEPAGETENPESAEDDVFPEDAPYPEDGGAPMQEDGPEPQSAPADAASGPRGKTTVSLSRIQRPGCMAAGTVSFGSGAKGEWILDQMGRLGFEQLTGKPDEQDIREFQLELRKAFGA